MNMEPIKDMIYPRTSGCPICGKDMTGDFATLNGGAMLHRSGDSWSMDETMAGFLTVVSHRDSTGTYIHAPVFDRVTGGQWEAYACSTECLKALVCRWIDDAIGTPKNKEQA